MTLSAVLFDLDGTLHDKDATLRAVAMAQYKQLVGHDVSADDWTGAFVALNNERIEKSAVFDRLAVDFRLGRTLRDALLKDFDANLGSYAKRMPGATEILEWCRSTGIRTAVVTNGRDQFQRSKIYGMGIVDMLDVIVTSGGFGAKKPAHAIFHSCLQALGVQCTEAVMIGDDPDADIRPAKELGMRSIYVGAGIGADATFSVNNLDEALQSLKREA